jgi:hypothetical protein
MSITGKIMLMTTFIFALLLALVMLYAVDLEKVYHDVVSREVKRQARQGDDLAKKLYLPLSYGLSLRIFLWAIILAAAAGSVILFASLTSTWLAFILIVATLGWRLVSQDVGTAPERSSPLSVSGAKADGQIGCRYLSGACAHRFI